MSDILTETEVAELLDCEPSTVQSKARAGELPGVKIGRSWRFPRAALLDALNRQAQANTAAKASPKPAATTRQPTPRRRAPPTLPGWPSPKPC